MSMEFKEIQELLRYINKSNLVKFEMEQGDFKLKIVRQGDPGQYPAQIVHQVMAQPQQQMQYAPQQMQQQQPQQIMGPRPEIDSAGENPQPRTAASDGALAANQKLITSPMIGTFYRRPAPDKADYINMGDRIEVGQTLCIIEAMKLFNEIESELSGKIVKILVENAQPVEYDQPLFVVEV